MTNYKLPKPDVQASSIIPRNGIYGPLYSEDTLRSEIAAAEKRGADAMKERCAKACDYRFMGDYNREDQEAKRCAAAIRSLK